VIDFEDKNYRSNYTTCSFILPGWILFVTYLSYLLSNPLSVRFSNHVISSAEVEIVELFQCKPRRLNYLVDIAIPYTACK